MKWLNNVGLPFGKNPNTKNNGLGDDITYLIIEQYELAEELMISNKLKTQLLNPTFGIPKEIEYDWRVNQHPSVSKYYEIKKKTVIFNWKTTIKMNFIIGDGMVTERIVYPVNSIITIAKVFEDIYNII